MRSDRPHNSHRYVRRSWFFSGAGAMQASDMGAPQLEQGGRYCCNVLIWLSSRGLMCPPQNQSAWKEGLQLGHHRDAEFTKCVPFLPPDRRGGVSKKIEPSAATGAYHAGDPALDYPDHLVGRWIVEVSPRAAHRRSVRGSRRANSAPPSAVHLGRGQLAGLATWGLRTQAHDRGVAPDKRHRGIGSSMIAKALSFTFDAHHVDRVDLGVSASNSAAIDCYDRAGFVRVGTWPKECFG